MSTRVILTCSFFGRGGGTRTPDLLLPKQVRYLLRYSPAELDDLPETYRTAGGTCARSRLLSFGLLRVQREVSAGTHRPSD
jgi:hypothetical protein